MKKFGLIGKDLSESFSKIMHTYIYKKYNISSMYLNIEIDNTSFSKVDKIIREKKIIGSNITFPYKNEIIKYCDIVNTKAEVIGAVNCIKVIKNKIYGFNTDYYGFLMTLKSNFVETKKKDIYVIGAGGSAYAIIYSLITLGCKNISVINRSTNRLKRIKRHFQNKLKYKIKTLNSIEKKIKCDSIIINCTSYGTKDLEGISPIDRNVFDSNHVVVDINYMPQKTKFLNDAENAGATAINGLDMLIYQALISIDIWMDKNVSNTIDAYKVKKILINEYAKQN
jgi:shikimate dehydrogenase